MSDLKMYLICHKCLDQIWGDSYNDCQSKLNLHLVSCEEHMKKRKEIQDIIDRVCNG